jgi:hypothetical protein
MLWLEPNLEFVNFLGGFNLKSREVFREAFSVCFSDTVNEEITLKGLLGNL